MLVKIEAVVTMVWPSKGKPTFGLWADSGNGRHVETQQVEISSTLENAFAIGDKLTITVEKK